jgi:hypothetical protein
VARTHCIGRLLALLVASSGGAAAQAPPSRDPAHYAGCYALRLGAWSGPFPSGQPSVHQPPPRFTLTNRVLPAPYGRLGYRRVESPTAAEPGTHPAPWSWRLVRGDSLEVSWSTGLAGVRLLLKIRPDTLRGWADARESGNPTGQPRAGAVVWRITCRGPRPAARRRARGGAARTRSP